MRQAFTDVNIEMSTRELEILAEGYGLLESLLGQDMNRYARIEKEVGSGMAQIKFPIGKQVTELMSVLRQFYNLYYIGDCKDPF